MDEKTCEVISKECGMNNINIDCNSKEGKMLVEVVKKESTLNKIEDK